MVKICGVSNLRKNGLIETSFSNEEEITSIVNDLKISNGIIFDTNKGLLGVIESDRIIFVVKEHYTVCGYDESEDIWYYKDIKNLDEVHDYLEDKDILVGYVFDSGELAYTIDENALISVNL